MTAEVIVVNKNAIAMAADSAVTVNNPFGAPKIYNTVNKLFNLNRNVPVALMVYGNAEFIGLPWETIVKTYRKRLGNTTFPSIEEYARDFIIYLSTIEFPKSDDVAAFETFISNNLARLSHQIRDKLRSIDKRLIKDNDDASLLTLFLCTAAGVDRKSTLKVFEAKKAASY